jgi:hypothetical protein
MQDHDQIPSVLERSSALGVRSEPFAHIVVDSPLDQEIYDRLSATFPPTEWFLRGFPKAGSNQAIRIPASQVVDNERFSREWREFFRYHTSRSFWDDIVRVFGQSLRAAHPSLERRVGRRLEEWRVARRGSSDEAEIGLDLLFVINTAVTSPSSVRPAHVDDERKIFSGLFYMRPKGDPTPGGDLALYRARSGQAKFGGHYAEPAEVVQTDLIRYGTNRFLGFVNSPASLHGVTPRPRTDRIRRYVNFVAEMRTPAFELQKLPLHRQLRLALRHRRNKKRGITLGTAKGSEPWAPPAGH